MRLLTVLVGKGTPDDPFRCPLPTWTLVEVDYDRKLALVEVPEYSLPRAEKGMPASIEIVRGKRVDYALPSIDDLLLWENIVAEKYPNHECKGNLKDIIRSR